MMEIKEVRDWFQRSSLFWPLASICQGLVMRLRPKQRVLDQQGIWADFLRWGMFGLMVDLLTVAGLILCTALFIATGRLDVSSLLFIALLIVSLALKVPFLDGYIKTLKSWNRVMEEDYCAILSGQRPTQTSD